MPITGEALIRVTSDVNGALSGINSLSTSLKNAGAATDALKAKSATGVGELKRLGGTVGEVITRMTGLSIGAVGVAGGIALVGKTIIDTTRESMKYALAVGDLSTKLGISAKEASKFYQIADDLRISTQSLELGFRMLTRNGIQPNTENIMRLADEYNAIVDPVQRAQFAMDKFGARAGLEMARMLDAGSDSIGRMADEAEKFGLVIDEEAAANAKEFYLILDKLKDRIEGVKIALGGGIIKFIVEEAEAMDKAKIATDFRVQAYEELRKQGIEPTVVSISRLAAQLEREAIAAGLAARGTGQLLGNAIYFLKGAVPPAVDALGAFTQAEISAQLAAINGQVDVNLLKSAIESLRSKDIVINVTTVNREINLMSSTSPTSWYDPSLVNQGGGGGGGGGSAWKKDYPGGFIKDGYIWTSRGNTGIKPYARGGDLRGADVAEVGEEGTEGIINGRVIPHGQWEAMKRSGVVAARRMRLGGEVESGGTIVGGTLPVLEPKRDVFTSNDFSDWSGYADSAFDTGGGGSTSATIAATAQATASAAAEAAAVSVATAMPQAISQAVSQQTAQQVQIQIASNAAQTNELRAIRRQLKLNNETIARTVRDAMASL